MLRSQIELLVLLWMVTTLSRMRQVNSMRSLWPDMAVLSLVVSLDVLIFLQFLTTFMYCFNIRRIMNQSSLSL